MAWFQATPPPTDLTTYWDNTVEKVLSHPPGDTWQHYCQQVHLALASVWLQERPRGQVLKTDLFEEATGAHGLWHHLARKGEVALGLDLSERTARLAYQRHRVESDNGREPGPAPCPVVSDVRVLPFVTNSLAGIFSNSTLDHFSHASGITRSLKEFHRVLRPGGFAVVTLDNPANPVVYLRNRFPLTRGLAGVPYHVGPTFSIAEARRAMERAGLAVQRTAAIIHSPRLLCILMSRAVKVVNHRGRDILLRFMQSCERLNALPTRYWTGYFVALLGVKPFPPEVEADGKRCDSPPHPRKDQQ